MTCKYPANYSWKPFASQSAKWCFVGFSFVFFSRHEGNVVDFIPILTGFWRNFDWKSAHVSCDEWQLLVPFLLLLLNVALFYVFSFSFIHSFFFCKSSVLFCFVSCAFFLRFCGNGIYNTQELSKLLLL